jgi:4'-phosphopantetheinyl transferase
MNTINVFYIQHASRLDEKYFQQYLLELPDDFRKELNAYKHWESAQASILGKMLLGYAFKRMDLPFSLQQLQLTEKDRPFIDDTIDFNISHSGHYVMAAVHPSGRVGIDIEKHRKIDYTLFKKYFNETEWSVIENTKENELAFFELWAIKESAIKCDGRGVEVLSKTHIDLGSSLSEGNLSPNQLLCDDKLYHFQSLSIDEKYSCSVCSDQPMEVNLYHLTIQDLLEGK